MEYSLIKTLENVLKNRYITRSITGGKIYIYTILTQRIHRPNTYNNTLLHV